MSFMSYLLQFHVLRVLIFILSLLPLSFSSWIARKTGNLFYFFSPGRGKIAAENLERAYGKALSAIQRKDIIRRSFENAALSILELFLIKKIKRHAEKHFVINGLENLKTALFQGKGAVLITSHLGSWEYLEFLFYLSRIPCSVIVKSVKNPYLNQLIDSLRRETSVIPIPKKKAIREALAGLRKNQVIAVLIDQWAGKEGLWIDFMGSPTATTSLPSRLAAKTGCALIPAYCLRKGTGRYEIQVLPSVPFPSGEQDWETSVTARLNQGLEDYIRLHTEQWLWAHRRWKARPETSR